MDKAKAMERLDAIEKEAKELRKIIDGKNIIYNMKNIYIIIGYDGPGILVGLDAAKYFRWHSFESHKTETAYGRPCETGQKAIDEKIKAGYEIHEFPDTREAFKFFLDNYKG